MRAALFLVVLVLFSCSRRTTCAVMERTHTDTVRIIDRRADSIVVRDSLVFADTALVYRSRTVYRQRFKIDTIYKTRRDSVPVPVITQAPKTPLPWYDRGAMWLGYAVAVAVLLWLLFNYIKNKK